MLNIYLKGLCRHVRTDTDGLKLDRAHSIQQPLSLTLTGLAAGAMKVGSVGACVRVGPSVGRGRVHSELFLPILLLLHPPRPRRRPQPCPRSPWPSRPASSSSNVVAALSASDIIPLLLLLPCLASPLALTHLMAKIEREGSEQRPRRRFRQQQQQQQLRRQQN